MKRVFQTILLMAALCILIFFSYKVRPHIVNNSDWQKDGEKKNTIIAHAMGGIDGKDYTNSYDAFAANYKKGTRVFEVDFLKTSDGKIVLRHTWDDELQTGIDKKNIPDENTFLNTNIYDKYKPLSLDELFVLMNEYPDIFIITDTKDDICEYLLKITDYAKANGYSECLDRLVIQIYEKGQKEKIDSIYPFDSYIFTLYKTDFNGSVANFVDVINYCASNNIDTITMWDAWWYSGFYEWKERAGVKVYTHTVNDPAAARSLISNGVDGIYSDFITEDDMND